MSDRNFSAVKSCVSLKRVEKGNLLEYIPSVLLFILIFMLIRFKHAVLGTHLSCLGCHSSTVS